MSKTKIGGRGVGYFVIDEDDPDNLRFYYELDYGTNPLGDVGLFYRNLMEDRPDGGICYIRTVDNGILYMDDPRFREYAYTYDDVLRICEGYKDAADYALEIAAGYGIEVIWESIRENYEDGEAEDRTTGVDNA